MKEKDKLKLIEERTSGLKGCTVKEVTIERQGEEVVMLKRLVLVSTGGDEFQVLPYDWQQIHIVQTQWGNEETKQAEMDKAPSQGFIVGKDLV